MLSSDETAAGGKPRERKAKPAQDDKGRSRKRKADAPVRDTARPANAPEQVEVEMSAAVSDPITETTALPSSADTSPVGPAIAEGIAPVGYRAIADAWGNYSRTSLEQTRSFFERLAGVRSLGAAFEVQAEFARQACETFVAQSWCIGELQSELTKQRLKRLEGFMERMTGARQR